MMRKRCSRGFTLIELMTVLAIVSVLVTLIIVNAGSVVRALGFNRGQRLVVDMLNFARDTAVTQSVPTVVVIRTTGPNAWRRMAVFSAAVSNTGRSNWIQIAAWQNLPPTAIVDSTYDPSSETWSTQASAITPSQVVAPAAQIYDGTSPLVYQTDYCTIGFLSDGTLQSNNNIALQISKCHPTTGGTVLDVGAGGLIQDWEKLIIVQGSGHVKELRKGN